jgi:hypothetical protein
MPETMEIPLTQGKVALRCHGVTVLIGRFDDKTDAARAYDKAAIDFFGEYAKTNKMLGLLPAA